MNDAEILELGNQILAYCEKYSVPPSYLFSILEDQKVVPMIRGKAMEYNAFVVLESILPRNSWSVQKLNLNAQPGIYDEDISITHRRTGIIIKVESKSGVRGSMRDGKRSRILKVPHFKVKCHRSRSSIKLAGTSNDRYSVDSFDIIITNPSNALIQGNTVGEELELIRKSGVKDVLVDFYNIQGDNDLIEASYNDWRFCVSEDIAEDGFIPRTPYVQLANDPNWHSISDVEERLNQIVQARHRRGERR